MEQCFQASKEVEELQKLQLHTHYKSTDKYQNVPAKVVTSFRDKKKCESCNVNRVSTDKVEIDEAQNRTNIFEYDKKQTASTKKVKPGMNTDILDKQKRTGKHKSQQKLQPKILSEPNVPKFNNIANGLDTQSTIKYKSQGIQTLDTDQLESIYSEGVIL